MALFFAGSSPSKWGPPPPPPFFSGQQQNKRKPVGPFTAEVLVLKPTTIQFFPLTTIQFSYSQTVLNRVCNVQCCTATFISFLLLMDPYCIRWNLFTAKNNGCDSNTYSRCHWFCGLRGHLGFSDKCPCLLTLKVKEVVNNNNA